MPCYRPLRGWKTKQRTVNGKRGITFDRKLGFEDQEVKLPCGRCIGCRLEYARQWAMRCMHEASLHDDNCFVTLTYEDAKLPYGNTLVKKDYQDFMKRLRWSIAPEKVRFYACGEYGDESLRPHYHAILFGYDPPDKIALPRKSEYPLWTSPELEELWGHGYVTVGSVTFESAGYVARYVTKKITGDMAEKHYWRVDEKTGKAHEVAPEFALMSRRPGIGRDWIDKYGLEVYRHDSVIVNGREVLPPKYYDNTLPEAKQEEIKAKRKYRAERTPLEERQEARTRVREEVKEAQTRSLKRGL